MANSSDLVTGALLAVADFNNLRADVLNLITGHIHDGTAGRLMSGGWFGDGADGPVTISSATSLTRTMYYSALTINAGQTLNTKGWILFVDGTLTINATAVVMNDGGVGAVQNGGAAGFFGPGGSGAIGYGAGLTPYVSPGPTWGWGGNGGNGSGGSGATVTAPHAARAFSEWLTAALYLASGSYTPWPIAGGGSGGGAGATYHGGGAGGVVCIIARSIVNNGIIRSNGAAGEGLSAGGGGGGVVLLGYRTATWGTEQANGGASGGGTGTAGAAGIIRKIAI